MTSTIKVRSEGRVARVTLDRPDVRNAFDQAMIREIGEAFAELNARTDIAAIVLSGEGKAFCAGADLGYMKSMAAFTLEENEADSNQLFEMFWQMRECPHPIVGRVHGFAMGGGVGLAALCDITLAVDSAQFCFSEVKLGLAPAVISPFVMEKMAQAPARRYMLSGEMFSARAACDAGLVQFVGSEAEVDAELAKITESLLKNGAEAMRATKRLLREVRQTSDWSVRRALTSRTIAERRVSDEGQEGLKSFFEKRAPKWV